MILAPIALFTYCRPDHIRRTVEALLRNSLAGESELIVFSDAARTPDKQQAVDEVRAYLETITGFRSITIKHRPENYGLAKSIIEGVTQVLQQSERIIVLEDDMVTSPYFLTYMNEGLEQYADEAKIASIHGYIYPIASRLPETFFIRGADCWGWATWRRAWQHFNPDGRYLLDELERQNLTEEFDFNGTFPYTQMLRDQIAGRNDSWAIRWYASVFLQDMVTLYPRQSLVRNIGTDGSGVHCGASSTMDVELISKPVCIELLPVSENHAARMAVTDYFRLLHIPPSHVHKRQAKRLRSLLRKYIYDMTFKDKLRDITPPLVWRTLKSLKRGSYPREAERAEPETIRFEGNFATWEEASVRCTGYDDTAILAKVLEATLKVKRGEAVFERDSVLLDRIEYAWPMLAGLMWAAARNGGRLNVLDFGGSLGSSYFQNCKFLQTLPEVRWNVVEQARYVEAGRANIQDERLRFHETIEECLIDNQPNVILLSSVLQYLPDPLGLLSSVLKIQADTIIIDRTCYVNEGNVEIIKIQHTPESIYTASYPCRFFVEDSLRRHVEEKGYLLLEVFYALDKLDSLATWKGHIFVRQNCD